MYIGYTEGMLQSSQCEVSKILPPIKIEISRSNALAT